jgi:Macrocin-O-methyltransferase (TylF)
MKSKAKAVVAHLAQTRPVRSVVSNLIYPTVLRCLHGEIRPDVVSPSGLLEAIAWKTHAYLVLNEELRPRGEDCSADAMRCDDQTRALVIETTLACAANIPGDILEFGVSGGESLRIFAERSPGRRVFGFDSFEGLPESWWTRPKGAFKADMPEINNINVSLIKGLFDDTVGPFLGWWQGRASIIHVDCDLYRSTLSCLMPIMPYCQVGTVLLFDEYYNYPGFEAHEWQAWREVRSHNRVFAPCIAYDGRRAAFQIEQIGGST